MNTLEYNLNDNIIDDESDKNNLVDSINVRELDSSLTIEEKFDPINQNDLDLIIEMGYNPKMAKKVYILLKPKDINETIDFLTMENGVYHHDFMERHGKNDVCFICGESEKYHINYIPPESIRRSIIESLKDSLGHTKTNANADIINYAVKKESLIGEDKKEDSIDKKNSNEIFCDLCFEDMTDEEVNENKILCGHLFCSDCYLNYFQDKIKNNKVGKITCMQHKCTHEFDEDFIISHLKGDQILINKYKKFKLRSDLYNDPNVKFCPIKDCESYAKKEGNNKYVTCLQGHQFCFVCSKPWHGRKKCSDEIDKDFKKWKKNKVIKKCPKCKMWTEKNLGCNHMTCAECKYQWCWLCGGKYTEGHFQIGGSCSGLQFSDSELLNNCFCLCLYKIWVLFYQMLIMMFLIPIYAFVKTSKYMDYDLSNCCASLFAFPIWFFLSISNLCLYVCIGTFLFIISLFFRCIKEKILEEMFDSY